MYTPRGDHTATLLSDGRVLITGGSNDSEENLAQAEIYDPATGKFSLTGTVGTVRVGATAVLLHDGRVLIVGGFHPGWPPRPYASAEIYDPKSGKFSPTGSMSTARFWDTATLLPDGRVLVAGGDDGSGWVNFASAEIYDPKSGKFSPTGSMTAARAGATASMLPDGRVLIAGGYDISGVLASAQWNDLASAEVYDPKTGTFSLTGSMTTPRSNQTDGVLSDGRVLLVGGSNGAELLATAELYDPKTGTFAAAGSMSTVHYGPTATPLSDGRVLIAGGFDSDQSALATAELFEP
jgi:uncharacterized protein (DUF2147 family)